MSIKIEPFKNNIGASILCDLNYKTDEVEKKKHSNNYGFVCFRNQNLEPGEYLKFAEQLLVKLKSIPC